MSEQRPRILAIDDKPENLYTLGVALSTDFDLQIATSGAMGLALAMEFQPDLILLDLMMPEMDGYETCRRLKADPLTRDIPVIFITARDSPLDEAYGLESGAVDFVTKPINPVVLRARLRTQLTLKRQSELLRSLAFIDGLTGIANRRRFDENLESEWRGCRRTRTPLSLVMIDIDQFKQFNDAYGHQAGDTCLQSVASVLKAGVGRSHDIVARYGGEEFVCLMPGADQAGAMIKAEALRLAVQALGIAHKGSTVAPVVTISLGVATAIPSAELTPERLLTAADASLYEAKRTGRNRTCCSEIL